MGDIYKKFKKNKKPSQVLSKKNPFKDFDSKKKRKIKI